MKSVLRTDNIPVYGLYGERLEPPDILHCERFPDRVWQFGGIGAHAHRNLHQFFHFEKNGGQALLDGEKHDLQPGLLLNVPAGSIHSFDPGSEQVGSVITIPTDLVEGGDLPDIETARLKTPCAVRSTDTVSRRIGEIEAEYHRPPSPVRSASLRLLAAILALDFARAIGSMSIDPRASSAKGKSGYLLTEKFLSLVELHFREQWPVSRYAAKLGVSATHLGRVVRSTRQLAPRDIITARIVLQARRDLAYSIKPVTRIAEELGFTDPAYFTRVIQRQTGLSPTALRSRLTGA